MDWNAELIRGDLGEAVRRLKADPLPRAFATPPEGGETPLFPPGIGASQKPLATAADPARRGARMNRSQKRLLWISLTIWFLSVGMGLAFSNPKTATHEWMDTPADICWLQPRH